MITTSVNDQAKKQENTMMALKKIARTAVNLSLPLKLCGIATMLLVISSPALAQAQEQQESNQRTQVQRDSERENKDTITQPVVAPASASGDDDIEFEHIVNPDTGDSGCYDHVEGTCGPC